MFPDSDEGPRNSRTRHNPRKNKGTAANEEDGVGIAAGAAGLEACLAVFGRSGGCSGKKLGCASISESSSCAYVSQQASVHNHPIPTPTRQLRPLSSPRAATSWAGGSTNARANGTALLFLVAAAAAATTARPAGEAAAAPVDHTLYVAGSASGRGLRETVVDVPKEVPLPGRPGPIDSVAFGPAWVAVAKEVCTVHIAVMLGR